MKRLEKPILVEMDGGNPAVFVFNGQSNQIESIEDRWKLQGNWWIREEKRSYFRVRTQKGIAVIYLRERMGSEPQWIIAELFD